MSLAGSPSSIHPQVQDPIGSTIHLPGDLNMQNPFLLLSQRHHSTSWCHPLSMTALPTLLSSLGCYSIPHLVRILLLHVLWTIFKTIQIRSLKNHQIYPIILSSTFSCLSSNPRRPRTPWRQSSCTAHGEYFTNIYRMSEWSLHCLWREGITHDCVFHGLRFAKASGYNLTDVKTLPRYNSK